MEFTDISTQKLLELSQNYQSKIDLLKRELEEYSRKNYLILEEINKRQKIAEFRQKVEEEAKTKIKKILSGEPRKSDPKKVEPETDIKSDQEKKWTIDDMKKLLDKKGVKYGSGLKKADFIKLIRENNGVREMNSLYKEKDK